MFCSCACLLSLDFCWSFILSNTGKTRSKIAIFGSKVECVLPMVIWSEFRIRQYRDDDHWEDVPHFSEKLLRDETALTEKVLGSFATTVPLGAVMIIFGLLSSTFRLWDQGFTNQGRKDSKTFLMFLPAGIPDIVFT